MTGSDSSVSRSSEQDGSERILTRLELERRLVHLSGAVFPVPYLLGWISWAKTEQFLLVGAGVVIVLETIRLTAGIWNSFFDRLIRPYERDGIAGYALYMIAMSGV